MKAFDYNSQQWVDGMKGARVRLDQLKNELEVLSSPVAEAYKRFLGLGNEITLDEMKAQVREKIAECERELGIVNAVVEMAPVMTGASANPFGAPMPRNRLELVLGNN